jgi:molecular chaperone HtpG
MLAIAVPNNIFKYKMKTGKINVQTENIFPIIKKFLYSDHEIFLRELVSNAVDASQKLHVLAGLGEYKKDINDLQVRVAIDKEAKTLTISDNGIGMTSEEIEKYITQIAFSGAEEFVEQYKGKEGTENIIGHFGLGFYSAFMVAERVQIKTLSHKEGSQAVIWESNGSPEYTIDETEKEAQGTDIILYIADDSLEFLEENRIESILNKYCKFLPIPVIFGTTTITEDDALGEKDEEGKVKQISKEIPQQINNTKPAWTKAPVDLSAEDYKNFYHELYPMNFDEPLFHIHLNVDYPFKLTGILYFPKIKENVEVQKNKINLYCNQVFISDNVETIVPEFLTLLHGVIDSPDIPLNVSRSYLQSDGAVKKIAGHITKKVADKLHDMFKKDRADFESKWKDLSVFVQYGSLTNEDFAKKAQAFTLLQNTENKYFTIAEYTEKIKAFQTNKDGKVVCLYTSDAQVQFSFVKAATDKAYDVLVFDGPLAPHFISKLEQGEGNISFARVDSDTLDKLIKKGDDASSKLSKEEEEKLLPVFESVAGSEKYKVSLENLDATDAPITITQPEFMRRMMEQQRLGGGGMSMFGAFPEMYQVAVNTNHPKVLSILGEADATVQNKKASMLLNLALLSQGMLKGEALDVFVKDSIALV